MKLTKVVLIFLLVFFIGFIVLGCFIQEKIDYKNTREEIIKFDEEYWEIAKQYEKDYDNFSIKIDKVYSNLEKHKNNIDLLYQDRLEEKNLYENYIIEYQEYIQKFKSLEIPEPLDNFYYKKLEQFNTLQEANDKYLSWLERVTRYTPSDIKSRKTLLDEEYIEKINKLFEEHENLLSEASDLALECDRIRREVYRQYNLDDLIKKWQQ